MAAEFDQYIKDYRGNLTQSLALSGESSIFFAEYKAQKLAEWLSPLIDKPVKILDFGCGDGMMTNFVSKYFSRAQLFGVDPSPKSIEDAQSKYVHINFSVNSETDSRLNFQDNMFDIIFCAGAFHHIPFDKHIGYLKEIKRICKQNSYIVLFELNPLNPLTVITFKRNPIDRNACMLKPWYGKRLGNSIGLAQVKFYCFFPKWFAWLRWLEQWLTKLPLGALYAVIIRT